MIAEQVDAARQPMTADRIRGIRERGGWNRTDFGRMLGTTYQTVLRWENGAKSPQPIFMRQLELIEQKQADQNLTV
jgi:DNA-binding transcriptional regulator YiaG